MSHNLITKQLLEKLEARKAIIGVIGLGYVGQPLALRFAQLGYKVLGFDIDAEKVDQLNAGHSQIEHINDADIAAANAAGMECTTDFSRASEADALILCVPTPLNKYREPDLSYVLNTTESFVPYLRAGQVVSLESTTYPGTTEEELLPRVTSGGLTVGEDIFLVYSPEREDPGNANFTTNTIPKVVGGHTAACLEVGRALYGQAIDRIVPVPNGISLDEVTNPAPLDPSHAAALSGGGFILGYAGTVGVANAMDVPLEAAARLRDLSDIMAISPAWSYP